MAGLRALSGLGGLLPDTKVGGVVDDLVTRGKARHVGTVSAPPTGIPVVSVGELKNRFDPLFKKPWVWALAGVAVLSGGYLLTRRGRK